MNTRLQQFLAAENITQAQLADSLDVARAGVSHIIAGRNKPSYDFLSALLHHYPSLNAEWLMLGKGKMYKDLQEKTVEKIQEQPAGLLFDDFDEIVEEKSDAQHSEPVNIHSTNKINNLDNAMQSIVKQRNVKKIIVLFDDGTFQEM
jgi:transcriptional regulator with XRE-family HTH domain